MYIDKTHYLIKQGVLKIKIYINFQSIFELKIKIYQKFFKRFANLANSFGPYLSQV